MKSPDPDGGHSSRPRPTPRVRVRVVRSTRPAPRRRSLAQTVRRKVRELDRQWNREQALRIAAPAAAVAGTMLGLFVHRMFFLVPVGVAVYKVQKPVRRWLPRILFIARVIDRVKAFRQRVRAAFNVAAG